MDSNIQLHVGKGTCIIYRFMIGHFKIDDDIDYTQCPIKTKTCLNIRVYKIANTYTTYQ